MDAIAVGIDVSKDWLDVHVHPAGDAFRVERTDAGIAALAGRLKPLGANWVAVEATGGLETLVVAGLCEAQLPVVVLNPARVRAYAQSLGKHAKTDAVDAEVIACFAAERKPAVRKLPDATARRLTDLLTRRRQIIGMIASDRQREQRTDDKATKASIVRLRKALEKELGRIDGDIDGQVRGSPAWLARETLLTSAPGVGQVVARTLMAELPELGTLDRRQVAALAGLAPRTRQSGRWRGKEAIGGGRSVVRGALFMAALSAMRCSPTLRAFRERLMAAGKARLSTVIAVARRLLTMLNAMVRDSTPWIEPEAHTSP